MGAQGRPGGRARGRHRPDRWEDGRGRQGAERRRGSPARGEEVKRVIATGLTVCLALGGCAGDGGGGAANSAVQVDRAAAGKSAPTTKPLASAATSRPATTRPATTRPASKYADSIQRGVDFLVKTQQPDGSWGTGLETRGYEVYHMVPGTHHGMRAATTALCVMALREAGEKTAHAKGVQYLVEHGQARRDHGALLYNIWAHKYALQALAKELQLPASQ